MQFSQLILGQIISLIFGVVFIYIAISSYKRLKLLNKIQKEITSKERKGKAISINFLLSFEEPHRSHKGIINILRNKLLFLLLLPALFYVFVVIALLSAIILQIYLGFFFFLIFGSIIFFLLNDEFLVGWKYVMFLSETAEKVTYDDLKYIRMIKEVLFENIIKYLIVGISVGLSALITMQISYILALAVAAYGSLFFEFAANANIVFTFLILLMLPVVGIYFVLKLLRRGYDYIKQAIAKRFGIELNTLDPAKHL